MTATKNNLQTTSPEINLHDEQILVLNRKDLFSLNPAWHGLLKTDFGPYLQLINDKKEFHSRSIMETDTLFKQIIPYLVFCHDNRYFIMQRRSNASETRLQSKFSLGIGGHIRHEDLQSDSIAEWAMREFHEEVSYDGNLTITPFGIINDDSNAVGQVHTGIVFIVHGTSSNISVKSELKSGELLTLTECKQYFNNMETWSQFVFEALLTQ